MVKYIGRSYKYNRSKISSPTLKKLVLSSSANHTSYTTTSTPTIMSHQIQHKDSTSIQNTLDISNTDDIHSCVTPRPKTEYQCSGHNYTPLFDTIDHYFTSFTCRVTKSNTLIPTW